MTISLQVKTAHCVLTEEETDLFIYFFLEVINDKHTTTISGSKRVFCLCRPHRGGSRDETMHITLSNGKVCKPQLYCVEISKTSVLFCEDMHWKPSLYQVRRRRKSKQAAAEVEIEKSLNRWNS